MKDNKPTYEDLKKRVKKLELENSNLKTNQIEINKPNELYLKIFEDFPALIWRSGLDKECDYFNNTWLEFTGRTLEQEIGNGWAEGVHPDDLDSCIQVYFNAFDKREPFEMEYRLKNKLNEYRWIRDYGRPFYDLDNTFLGYIGSCYDITENKENVLQLHNEKENAEESRGKYRMLVDNIYDLVCEIDSNGHYTFLSSNYKDILGYEPEELLGEPAIKLIHPEDLEASVKKYEIIKNESGTSEDVWRFLHKDGTYRYVESKGKVYQHAENEQRTVVISRDITENRENELQLHAAKEKAEEIEKRLSLILNESPFPIAVADINNERILYWSNSAKKMFGHTPKIVSEWFKAAYPDSEYRNSVIERWNSLLEKAKKTGKSINTGEYEITCKDGSIKICELHAQFIPNNLVVSFNEVTHKKSAENELIAAKEKTEESESRYKQLIETASDAIYIVDEKGVVIDTNNAATQSLQKTRGEIIGSGIDTVDPNFPISSFIEYWESVPVGKQKIFETTHITKKGNLIPIEISGNKFIISNKAYYYGIARDLTTRKEALRTLQESEEKYRLLSENVSDGIILIENDKIEYISPGYAKLLGYSTELLNNLGLEEIYKYIHPDDREHIRNEIANAHANRIEKYAYVYRTRKSNDDYIWIEDSINSEYDENGKRTRTIVRARDISELKNAEFELKKSLYRFSALVEHIQSGVFYINTKGEILEANQALLEMLGSPSKEKTQEINIFEFQPLIKIGYADKLKECIETQKILKGETKYISKWGKEAIVNYYFVPIIENDAVVGVLANNEDVTEQRKAERALKESEQRLKLASQSAELGIWDWNVKENTMVWDERMYELYGTKKEAFIKTVDAWINGLHPEDKERALAECNDALEGHSNFNPTFRVLHPDGKVLYIKADSLVLRDSNGEAARMIGVNRDVTESKMHEFELKKAKEKAEEASRLKTEFLNNMSHEVRTPMNGIIGFSKMLDKPELSDNKRKYYAKIIQNSSSQLLRIIDDILAISTLETKQEKPNETEFCLNDLLMEQFSIFNLKSKERKIPLYVKKALRDDQSHIVSDKTKLNKIVSNLIENAIKFTNKGFIEIGYLIEKGNLKIYVKDTGIGIAPENQQIIFERFSQENKEISKKHGGLGLGLSISKENAQLLGGTITLESEKGKGSTFYVTIPFKPTHSEIENRANENKKSTEKQDKYTILIVEDEEVNYLYLETLLEDEIEFNCNTLHAKNGAEAVEICKSNNEIDLVLMDLKMPVMNGYEATKLIKQIKPDLPIVAQTAYTTDEDKAKALAAGCDNFITKPIAEEALNKIILQYVI